MSDSQQRLDDTRAKSAGLYPLSHGDNLLLLETNHRCSNDLQLVVSLLGLQSRRAAIPEVRHALADAMERVSIIARARHDLHRERQRSLTATLQQLCEALSVYTEPRSIEISFHADDEVYDVSETSITVVALVANELMTNAIKHAFEEGKSGHIRVSISQHDAGQNDASQRDRREVIVIVDDDGLPFPEATGEGLGMGLVKRLMASIGGTVVMPPPGSKVFELRVPVATREA